MLHLRMQTLATSPKNPIVIVGGGVAGLATANALAAHGRHSIVLEKTSAPGEIDRGDVIHHSSLEIFGKWGVIEALRKCGPEKVNLFRVLAHDGTVQFEFDLKRDLDPPAPLTILPHPEIQRMLEMVAQQTGYVRIVRPTTCQNLITRNGRVVGVRTDRGAIDSRLTIIANGAYSKLRDHYFPPRLYHEYPVSFLNIRGKGVDAFREAACYVLGPRGVMILAPLPRGEIRVGLQFSRLISGSRIDINDAPEVIAQRLCGFPSEQLQIIDAHTYRVSRSLGKRLWIPGAIVVGDAAHTTHPAGGQGMNLAFQDADTLAQCLSDTGFARDLCDHASARYCVARRRAVKLVLRRTHLMGLFAGLTRSTGVRMRSCTLTMLNRSPPMKRWLVRRIVESR